MNSRTALILRRTLLTIGVCVSVLQVRATDLVGTVTDLSNQASLPGASVTIVENGRSAVTDATGRFHFDALAAGTYSLRVAYIGFDEKIATVTVPASGTTQTTIGLGEGIMQLSEFRVEGYREGRSKALQQKRTAENIMDIISADSVGNLPDRNVADALSRLPGLSIDVEGGEGRWVTIRGIEPQLNNVTLNGATLATPDTDGRGGRAMPLDVVGSSQVSQIEVIKSVTPDMDGNALGGTINIKSGSAFDHNERLIRGSVEVGENNATSGSLYKVEGTFADRFGSKKDFGISASLHFSHRPFRADEIQGDFKTFNNQFYLETFELHPTEGERDRIGANLDLEYRPEGGAQLYLRTIINSLSQEERQSQANFTLRRDPTFVTPTQVSVNRMRYDYRTAYRESEQYLFNITGGGSVKRGPLTLKGELTFSQAKEWNPVSINAQFRTGNVNQTNPLFTLGFDGFYPEFDQSLPPANGALFPMRRLIDETRNIREDTWTPRFDVRWDSDRLLGSHSGYLQAGVKYTHRDRFVDRESTRPNFEDETLASLGAADPGESLFDGRYRTNATVNVHRVFDFYRSNPDLFEVDPVDEATNEVEDDYDTQEKIQAVYLMGQIKLSDRLTLLGGARYEKTDATMKSFELRTEDDEIDGIYPQSAEFGYDNFLPNLQARFQLADRRILRLAITGTIGRPRYEDTASQSILEYAPLVDPDNPAFPYTGTIDPIGNSDLQPYEALNFDLSFEQYLQKGGMVALAVFHKEIDNPIYSYRSTRDDYVYNGLGFETLELRSVRNADAGKVSGVEANAQLPFNSFLDGWLGRFGIDLNASFIKSEATLNADPDNPRDLNIPFFRQPDRIYNAGFYYQGVRFSARVAYNYQSNSIREISDTPDFDIYRAEREQIDLQASFKLTERYRIYANWQNVTDEPTAETFGDRDDRIRRAQLFGWNAAAGIRFTF